jgi:hypothetical protein
VKIVSIPYRNVINMPKLIKKPLGDYLPKGRRQGRKGLKPAMA